MARLRPQMSREPEVLEGNQPGGSFNVKLFPGTGLPADQVQLRDTDITPYLNDPSLAQKEADLVKARYGGKSIQESPGGTPPMSAAPYQKPQTQQAAAPDYSNRSAFEDNVFKQIGGNPFEINPIERVNTLSQQFEQQLFQQVFQNHVLYEDRGRMSAEQNKHWDAELNAFRADLKERIEADKKTKIDTYNNLMKRFDNEAKELEAAKKRVAQRNKEFMQQQRNTESDIRTLNKEKLDLLKRLTEMSVGRIEGQDMDKTEIQELKEIRARLSEINQGVRNLKAETKPTLKPKSAAPDTPAMAMPKPKSAGPGERAQTPRTNTMTGQDAELAPLTDDEIQRRYNEYRRQNKTPGEIRTLFLNEGIELS